MAWSMMPCRPAMMFWSIVGHASLQTAWPIGPSTSERSNRWTALGAGAGMAGLDSVTVAGLAASAASFASKVLLLLENRLETAAKHPLPAEGHRLSLHAGFNSLLGDRQHVRHRDSFWLQTPVAIRQFRLLPITWFTVSGVPGFRDRLSTREGAPQA